MMKIRQLVRPLARRRGSALLLILFLTMALCVMIGPLMMATLNETKMNERHIVTMEAKNAAESAVEYGVATLKLRWDNETNFPANALVTQPLSIPANISTMLWNGTVVSPTSVVLTGGLVPSGAEIYIDPTNPANQFDPQRGKMVFARDVVVYAKATANTTFGGTTTAYAEEALEVRDGALFADAIFYNMDLEFHPGPAMSIMGPVHCNGNIWAVAQSGLTFMGPVTTSGNFNVGLIPWPTNWGSSTESSQTGATVYLPNGTGGNTSPYRGSGTQTVSSSYYDSRSTTFTGNYTTWAQLASARWGGNLQTGIMGVQDQNVVGYDSYMSYNGTGTGTILNKDENYAYAIIEPNQFNPATNPYHQGAGEDQKFDREASLIVRVYPGPALTTPTNITLDSNVTATVYANNMIVFTCPGNSSQATGNLDNVIGNFVAAANSSGGNATLLGNITGLLGGLFGGGGNSSANYSLAVNATLPAADPTGDPYANISVQKPFLLVTQTQNKSAVTANVNQALDYAAGNATNDMQWTTTSGNVSTTRRVVGYTWASMSTLQTTIGSNGLRTPVYAPNTSITDSYGDTIYQGDVIEQPVAVNATMIVGNYSGGTYTAGPLRKLLQFSPGVGNLSANTTLSQSGGNLTTGVTSGNTSDLWGGLYDGRRALAAPVKTVSVDVGQLRNVVDDNTANFTSNSTQFFGNSTGSYSPVNQYNGIVYVDFPMNAPDTSREANVTVANVTYPGDKMLTSQDGWGLVLANATSQPLTYGSAHPGYGVPDPTYNDPTLSANATARTPGFTVATNNAMYVLGNYNADGNISTPVSPYNPAINGDNATHPDPSCALAADAITILSSNWLNRKSPSDNTSSGGADTASNDEVCAGFVTGIVPSLSYTTTTESGGAHNFPRFLENWGSATFVYRGSLVGLFASEVAKQPWGDSTYYSPPARDWGYYSQFSNGVYPPGTPSSRSYRRVNFQFLTAAQYNAAIAGLPTH
jgi:hypothetical protein